MRQLLDAACASPIAVCRYENMHLTVVSDSVIMNAFEENDSRAKGQESHPFHGAPQMIVISVKPFESDLQNMEYANAGIVAENICLAATALGIGSCMIWGTFRRALANQELLDMLKLPEGFIPCGAVIVGETEEKFAPQKGRHCMKINSLGWTEEGKEINPFVNC